MVRTCVVRVRVCAMISLLNPTRIPRGIIAIVTVMRADCYRKRYANCITPPVENRLHRLTRTGYVSLCYRDPISRVIISVGCNLGHAISGTAFRGPASARTSNAYFVRNAYLSSIYRDYLNRFPIALRTQIKRNESCK